MTPQAKSLDGSSSCGFYIGQSFQQGMPAGLSCLYAASPPLHSMFSQYGKLQSSEKRHNFQSHQHIASQYLCPIHQNGRGSEVDGDDKLRYFRNFSGDIGPMKSCLKPRSSASKVKNVTFADAVGLQLTDVKYVAEATEDPPPWEGLDEIYKCLVNKDGNLSLDTPEPSRGLLEADFDQPSADYLKFKEKLEKNNVCLENIMFNVHGVISGTVMVKNICYEKTVFVRITFDEWKSFHDYNASFVKSFSDYEACEYDTFQFSIPLPDTFDCTKQRAVFCISYQADGQKFWDNNDGSNYSAKSKAFAALDNSARTFRSSRFSLPNTYEELPTPEFKTWMEWEKRGPFY